MANILDYLDWREDLTLAQDPFNEVDNLILAELSFVDFGGIVPGPGEGRAVPCGRRRRRILPKRKAGPSTWAFWCPIRFRSCCAGRQPRPGSGT